MIATLAFIALQQAAATGMRATLPSGQDLNLIAVGQAGRTWSPTGGAAPVRDYLRDLPLDPHTLLFVIEYERPSSNDYPRIAVQLLPKGKVFECDTNTMEPAGSPSLGKLRRWHAFGLVPSPPEPGRADLRVGCAYGKWHAMDTIYVLHGKVQGSSRLSKVSDLGDDHGTVHFRVNLPKDLSTSAVRVVAFDKRGHMLEGHGSMAAGSTREYFFGGSSASLSKIQVQEEPYSWIVFKGVTIRHS